MLLLSIAMASCKKQQIRKETKRVAGTFRGQAELYHQETHWESSKVILDRAYNSVKEVTITIEKTDIDQIFVYEDNNTGITLKYAGHNMQSTYNDWDKFGDRRDTIVYYPSTDSLFIVRKTTGGNNQYPPKQYLTNYYFKGKRVSD